MLTTSQHIATISSSLTSERIFATRLWSRPPMAFFAGFNCVRASSFAGEGARATLLLQTKIVGIWAELFIASFCDQEIIFQSQPASSRPVNSGLDRQHHVFPDSPAPGLMGIRK